jgi:tyrosyl-tRNA synthetase
VLLESGFATSKGDARRALEQNGVKVNQAVLTDLSHEVAPGDIVQKGKRFFVKII